VFTIEHFAGTLRSLNTDRTSSNVKPPRASRLLGISSNLDRVLFWSIVTSRRTRVYARWSLCSAIALVNSAPSNRICEE
jgi:hypothetical protein